ncbi:VgrG protein [Porphyromonas crevioricanis JCM 13913]|nr:VgrG protein [Porphyromonas crevioricanis JCM 13913]
MVGFEYGDPHRPYVTGSLFHGKSGKGGGTDNKVKSFSSRSGNYLRLNGANGSVVLASPEGAVFQRFDKDGNAIIKATKTHSVSAKEKVSIEIVPKLPKEKDTPNDNTPPPPPFATFSLNNEGVIDIVGKKTITINVGSSKITLSDGKITIEGAKIDVKGEIEMN